MSYRIYGILMLAATAVAWMSWYLVVRAVDPQQGAWWGLGLFYFTLFLSAFGTLTTLGFAVRSLFAIHRRPPSDRAVISLRHAALWSLALISSLALQGARLLTWWILGLLLITFALIEFFIMSAHREQA